MRRLDRAMRKYHHDKNHPEDTPVSLGESLRRIAEQNDSEPKKGP